MDNSYEHLKFISASEGDNGYAFLLGINHDVRIVAALGLVKLLIS